MKKKNKRIKFNKKIIILSIMQISILVTFLSLYNIFISVSLDESQLVSSTKENTVYDEYVSEKLALSYRYPKDWVIQEKDLSIYIVSSNNDEELNDASKRAKVEIYIKDANLCQSTIDEEFEKGGCGEVSGISKDRINRNTYNLKSGILYKYIISYTQNPQQTFYYLEKGDRLLQISKEPDPSEYDQEFEEIINSIKFL